MDRQELPEGGEEPEEEGRRRRGRRAAGAGGPERGAGVAGTDGSERGAGAAGADGSERGAGAAGTDGPGRGAGAAGAEDPERGVGTAGAGGPGRGTGAAGAEDPEKGTGPEDLESRRRQAVERLRRAVDLECRGMGTETSAAECEDLLWDALLLFQGCPFETAKKLRYTYRIRGYEIFVSRKDKSITRSSVNLACGMAIRLLKEGRQIAGPKKLGTFGASYLYPIFIRIGMIPAERTGKNGKGPPSTGSPAECGRLTG